MTAKKWFVTVRVAFLGQGIVSICEAPSVTSAMYSRLLRVNTLSNEHCYFI
jgi:hypothetical protein